MAYTLEDIQSCEKCGNEINGDVCPDCYVPEKGWPLPFCLERFIPNYSELSLYSMALTVILILLFYVESRKLISRLLDQEEAIIILGYFGVGCLAIYLCIYHVFSKKRKSILEKKLMLSFAFLTNFLSGLLSGFYWLEKTAGFYAIFPIFTILNSIVFGVLMKLEVININSISDENIPLWQVISSTVAVLVVFYIFKETLDRQWFLTFSACVFYATNINRPVIIALENFGRQRRRITCQ